MFELFGDALPLPAKFFIAFAVVLALIGLTAWLVRRFGANRLGGGNARGRQPRLAVIDAAAVDGRRRLVLIRRDNVEHLLMIGGPTDVVVEQNIVRAATSASREPARGESSPRPAQPVENSWPLQPASEPTPVPAPRPYRTSATEEPWLPPEPGARARPADSNSLTGLAVELSTRLAPPEPASPTIARSEPPARVNPPPVPPVAAPVLAPEPLAAVPPQDDHNLAEMAQQLEAALRRAPMPEPRPPVSDPLAAQAAAKPADAPRASGRDYKLRIDPRFEARADSKFEPKFESKPEPRFDQRPEPKFEAAPEPRVEARPAEPRQPPPAGKAVFDSLDEEMASLLGRPPGKT
jgi:hypothetical protein